MTGLLLLAGAAALLVLGAELFTEHAAGAARRLGVSVVAIGVLLAGAEPEELVTAVLASLRDRPDLAAGDAIGANVTMLTLALGLAACVATAGLPVGRQVRTYAVGAAAAGALAVVALADSDVARWEGALLVGVYVVLVGVVWWRERRPPVIGELAELETQDESSERDARGSVGDVVFVLVGIGVMLGGGLLAVLGAEQVVDGLDAKDSVVGLTLLALATTAELFALVWAGLRHRVAEVAVAAVVGSAAYNATATLGAAALARPLSVSGVLGSAVLAAVLPLLLVALSQRGALPRAGGVLLAVVYVGWVVALLT